MDAIYLWYREIPDVDAASYTAAQYGSVPDALDAYFQALKTPKRTASGKLEDNFSFTYPTDRWDALSQAGLYVSYGLQFAALANPPPRDSISEDSRVGKEWVSTCRSRGSPRY